MPQKILSAEPVVNKNVVIDSLLLQAVADYKNDSIQGKESKKISQTDNQSKQVDTQAEDSLLPQNQETRYLSQQDFQINSAIGSDNWNYLESFFSRLYELEHNSSKRVRIAYYGDSMTDGDMIVQDLRAQFQKTYGGSGVGFIPINVESSRSRASIVHRYSSNWNTQSYVNTKHPANPFGVSGHVFFVKDSSGSAKLSIQAGGLANMKALYNPTLYYGKSPRKGSEVQVIVNKDTIHKSLAAQGKLNKLLLIPGAVSKIDLNFVDSDSIAFYGVDVSGKTGVQVDNYSSRGNSGLPISLFSPSFMQSFDKDLDYGLIILHFGTNVLNYGSYNYGWYTKQMGRVVDHLRHCFPNASILVVSTADKSTKYESVMQTDSAVVPLVKAQKRYALDKQVGFFNLYQAMGGEGSMVKWVEELPTRANKDYTHFNYNGAKQVAGLMFDQIQNAYLIYKEKRQKQEAVLQKQQSDLHQQSIKKQVDSLEVEN
ncbi:SGNH/GDSL hydrolase family protein [Myroides sp. LJL119]